MMLIVSFQYHCLFLADSSPLFQNKDFIYIGTELERLGEFMQRVQEQFPGSELLRTTDVSQDVMNGPGKHILEIR